MGIHKVTDVMLPYMALQAVNILSSFDLTNMASWKNQKY